MEQHPLRLAGYTFPNTGENAPLRCLFRVDGCDAGILRVTRASQGGISSLRSRGRGHLSYFRGTLSAGQVQSAWKASPQKLTWKIKRNKLHHPACTEHLNGQRRSFMKQSIAPDPMFRSAALADPSLAGTPTKGLEVLPFKENGYDYWTWQDRKVHYVVRGEGKPIVLIHGFGASIFHWRYNIPELARQGYRVYAMDLLGFGWTEKALIDYSPSIWKDQVADFLKEVVGEPVVLVGNSLGGFTVLYTAALYPELVSGVALLNASGQFDSPPGTEEKKLVVEETAVQRLFTPIKNFAKRWAIAFAFWQAKQPGKIKSVLKNVYKDRTNVDDYLVQSILQPAQDPNAGQAYYRMMTGFMSKSSELTLNTLLGRLECPLLLLWGELDPWIGAGKADKILELYPSATLVRLQAGHCPHDEAPEAFNKALVTWLGTL